MKPEQFESEKQEKEALERIKERRTQRGEKPLDFLAEKIVGLVEKRKKVKETLKLSSDAQALQDITAEAKRWGKMRKAGWQKEEK